MTNLDISSYNNASDVALLPDFMGEDAVYSPETEQASEETLRSWILEQGISVEELTLLVEVGFTLQQIAEDHGYCQ